MTYDHATKNQPWMPDRLTYHYIGCWNYPGHEECRLAQNTVRGPTLMAADNEESSKFTPKDSLEWIIVDALIGAGAAVEGAKTEKERESARKRVARYQAILNRFQDLGEWTGTSSR